MNSSSYSASVNNFLKFLSLHLYTNSNSDLSTALKRVIHFCGQVGKLSTTLSSSY